MSNDYCMDRGNIRDIPCLRPVLHQVPEPLSLPSMSVCRRRTLEHQ